jgi:hypothetical protein
MDFIRGVLTGLFSGQQPETVVKQAEQQQSETVENSKQDCRRWCCNPQTHHQKDKLWSYPAFRLE